MRLWFWNSRQDAAYANLVERLDGLEKKVDQAVDVTRTVSTTRTDARPKRAVSAESLIAALSILGISFYGITYLGYAGFYQRLGLEPEDVGITYSFVAVRASVFALAVLFLIFFLSIMYILLVPMTSGQAPVGLIVGIILFGAVLLMLVVGPRGGVWALFVSGILLSAYALFARSQLELTLDDYKWRRKLNRVLGRVRRRSVNERRRQRRLRKYLKTRRRVRGIAAQRSLLRKKARQQKRIDNLRNLRLAYFIPTLCMLLVFLAVSVLVVGDEAAGRVMKGETPFGARSLMPILINPRTTQVRLICSPPIQSCFSNLTYLGSNQGVYAIYDVTNQRALLLSSENAIVEIENTDP